MRKPMLDERTAYEKMKNMKEKFGVFHKTCFHVHTPESYDYKLLGQWSEKEYNLATEREIYDICRQRKVFPEAVMLDDITLEHNEAYYVNKKEKLSYLLLAHTIFANDIEIVLVTDHHTVKGVKKLECAIHELYRLKKCNIYPEVILGVEISCADKNHIVGIFDNTSENIFAIEKWLSENLLSIKDGSYRTSIEALKFIRSIGGIGYVAHINTSNIFSDSYLSGAYKKKLLSDEVINLIGVTNQKYITSIQQKIKNYRKAEIGIILDNDAHDVDSLNYNLFWIKGSKRNYSMIREALNDYDISISFKKDEETEQYIKGIYCEKTQNGFLCGKNNDDFCLTFSNALNCLIGGRGTGKSTILELLEYVLGQRCKDITSLDFLCAHGNTWVLYQYGSDEYLIEMRMPVKENVDENILHLFGQNPYDKYNYKYSFDQNEVRRYTLDKFLKIGKVVRVNDEWYLEPVSSKRSMLDKFFDVRYSVNDLVNTASSDRINDFLYRTLFQNKTLSKPEEVIRFRRKSGLCAALDKAQNILQTRKEEVEEVVNSFNLSQKDILRITYSQDNVYSDPDFAAWIFGNRYQKEKWFNNYNVSNETIIEYLMILYNNLGIFEFLQMINKRDIEKAFHIQKLSEFGVELTQDMAEKGVMSLGKENEKNVLELLFKKVITDDNIGEIIDYLKQYVRHIEKFSLEFNINNKEGSSAKIIYKPVRSLSLGQKVVAMLSFVLGYSEYSGDYRPLIIDQPEDNLDNQYIYKNLVKQLRLIKEKRQIIIATHNATIVTNAKADQVCLICSDNQHGWIETTGYPGEKRIKRHIINYLEGGKESFLHKILIYEDALN